MLEAVATFEGYCCSQLAIERTDQPIVSGDLFLFAPSQPSRYRVRCWLVFADHVDCGMYHGIGLSYLYQ